VPSSQFERALFDGVVLSWTAFDNAATPEPVALVQLFRVSPLDRHGEMLAASFTPTRPGLAGEAMLLACDEAFAQRDLRRLYFHLSDTSAEHFQATLGEYIEIEGVLREHALFDGRYEDVTIAVATRERFAAGIAERPPLAALSLDSWRCLPASRERSSSGGDPVGASTAHQIDALFDTLRAALGCAQPDELPATALLTPVWEESLFSLEVLVAVEELAGHELEPSALASLETVGELLAFVSSVANLDAALLDAPGVEQ
jgi:hypothetical protein